MRAVLLGDGFERTGHDYGRQIDFGGEGTFRIDRAVHGSLLELETSPPLPTLDLTERFHSNI
jgi:hypothetical protein